MRPKVIANSSRALSKGGANRGIRLGARSLTHFRNIRVNFGKSYGHCEVVYEPGTKVYAQLSASVGEPMDSRPGEGVLTVSVWVSPAATGEMVGNSQRPALIARTIERLFKENRAVDLESLCIRFGEKAWILRCDVQVIDMNGCLQEACVLAVLGAFLTFRRPNAYIDPDTDKLVVESIDESTPVKLHMFHLPVLTSFALCEGKVLAEPNHEEEEIYPGKLVIGMNDSKEICYLHITTAIAEDLLLETTKLAQVKCLERVNWIKDLAADNIKEREVPLYLRQPGARKTGSEIKISVAEKLLPSTSELRPMTTKTIKKYPTKRSSQSEGESSGFPKLDLSKIQILEQLTV